MWIHTYRQICESPQRRSLASAPHSSGWFSGWWPAGSGPLPSMSKHHFIRKLRLARPLRLPPRHRGYKTRWASGRAASWLWWKSESLSPAPVCREVVSITRQRNVDTTFQNWTEIENVSWSKFTQIQFWGLSISTFCCTSSLQQRGGKYFLLIYIYLTLVTTIVKSIVITNIFLYAERNIVT